MLTKAHISSCKGQGNGALLHLVKAHPDRKSTLFILENLGHLPADFDDAWVLPLLASPNHKIRLWSAKTLAKSKKIANINALHKTAMNDESTEVRREAVAAIGRLKSKTTIPVLKKFLNNDDPKIALQAIRGLLPFKSDAGVDKALQSLCRHPNETVRAVIRKEYHSDNTVAGGEDHTRSPDFLKNVVVLGDVRETLRTVPDESFHLTFTSPPYYNARDYSIYKSYREYLEFLRQVFDLTRQKTKPGRFLIVNTSPIIIPRVSRQHASCRYPIPFDLHGILSAMDWEFIDDIVWEKPESSVKNRNAGFLQHRKPLAYKPNAVTEYLMVYRKKTDKLLDWNIRQYDRSTVADSKVAGDYETSNVWKIDPKHSKVHSAVFPAALCERVVRYYSFKNDLVFDPFAGSGTFGATAQKLGRFFFLTERNKTYFEHIKSRLPAGGMFEKQTGSNTFLSLRKFKKTL